MAQTDRGARRLLLINPALSAEGQRLNNVAGVTTMEPLGLAYVAALTPPNWDIRLVDEVAEPLDLQLAADLVGITALTVTAPRAYELATNFRRRGTPRGAGRTASDAPAG